MKTCLVVDDSRVTRKIARRILENLQFEVTEANDGAKALSLCEVAMPDAVLLDWNMPVMDGMSFLKALRKTEGGKVPVVVFCTTENDLEHITDALTEGANEYVMKPFDAEILESGGFCEVRGDDDGAARGPVAKSGEGSRLDRINGLQTL